MEEGRIGRPIAGTGKSRDTLAAYRSQNRQSSRGLGGQGVKRMAGFGKNWAGPFIAGFPWQCRGFGKILALRMK